MRADLDITPVEAAPNTWHNQPDSMDAITAYDAVVGDAFLHAALAALRPGGRLVIVNPADAVSESWVKTLENAGYTRILVEPALDEQGVLIRGEKPHMEPRTADRIQQVSARDDNPLDVAAYTGRYAHLLIQQTPNKPAWRLAPGERIEWQAVALATESEPMLLAFSSLPRAVAFMQPAVMSGRIKDVNKVAKFSRDAVQQWTSPVIFNPMLDTLEGRTVVLLPVDRQTAEAADE